MIIAAIRTGKSRAGAAEAAKRVVALGERGTLVAPTYEAADYIVQDTMLEIIPPDEITYLSWYKHELHTKSGGVFLWRTAEKPNRIRWLGDQNFMWLDEAAQQPEVVYRLAQGRVGRVGGSIFITTSPQKWVGGAARKLSWLHKILTDKGIHLEPGEPGYYTGENMAVIKWRAEDSPYFPADEIAYLTQEYGPKWTAQELGADWVDLYGGEVFVEDWFKAAPLPSSFQEVIISVDPAISKKALADYFVAQVWGDAEGHYYLIEERRGHYNFPEQKKLLTTLYDKYKMASVVLIEEAGYQASLPQDLKAELGLPTRGFPVREYGDKEARANKITGKLEGGFVSFAEDVLTPEFKAEFTEFPNWPNNDRVDATTQAIIFLSERARRRGFKPAKRKIVWSAAR